jgi:hypothetical protein
MAWLENCLICNSGLCVEVDKRKERGLSERAACKELSEESDGFYSEDAILSRYRYYTNKTKRQDCGVCEIHMDVQRYEIENLKHELETIDLIDSDTEKIKRFKNIAERAGKMQNDMAEYTIRLQRKAGELFNGKDEGLLQYLEEHMNTDFYKFTAIGLEINRPSTKEEWREYGLRLKELCDRQ